MMAEALMLDQCDGVELTPLSMLRPGQFGNIGAIVGDHELVHRLREMGLYQGARIQMIRAGSPCIIGLDGHRLGFRCNDLASILVRLQGRPS